jgi:hypothetical protein
VRLHVDAQVLHAPPSVARARETGREGTPIAPGPRMASSSSLGSPIHVAPTSSAPSVGPRAQRRLPRGTASALIAIAGGVLALAGGGWKANAFNLYPREDGLFTAGVVAVMLTFGHGLRERTALLASVPILAVSFYGILRFHHAPLALFGAELACVGVIGLAFERWRARTDAPGA